MHDNNNNNNSENVIVKRVMDDDSQETQKQNILTSFQRIEENSPTIFISYIQYNKCMKR